MQGKVVVIEDNDDLREIVSDIVSDKGLEVVGAASGHEGLEQVRKHEPDLVLLDLVMPDMTGIQVLKEIKKSYPRIMVVVVTGISDENTAKEAIGFGADDYLIKPIDIASFERDILNRVFS